MEEIRVSKQFYCEECQKSFSTKRNLILHEMTHTGEKPFECDQCERAFKTNHELKMHYRTHTKECPFVCDVCDKAFPRSTDLKRHMIIHTRDSAYTCELCSKSFKTIGYLEYHMKKHAEERERKPFEKKHPCDLCEKSYRTPVELIDHKRTHTGERPFSCDLCDKTFTRKNALAKHQITHTGEKPFKCEICNKCYARNEDLKQHNLLHGGQSRFTCDVCNKAFMRNRSLQNHKKKCTIESFLLLKAKASTSVLHFVANGETIKQEIKEEEIESDNFIDPAYFVKSELVEDIDENIKEEMEDNEEVDAMCYADVSMSSDPETHPSTSEADQTKTGIKDVQERQFPFIERGEEVKHETDAVSEERNLELTTSKPDLVTN